MHFKMAYFDDMVIILNNLISKYTHHMVALPENRSIESLLF